MDIQWTGPTVVDPPGDVLADGKLLVADGAAPPFDLNSEAKAVVNAYGTTNVLSDIHVFYVIDPTGLGAVQAGIAVADFAFVGADADYTYNLFLDDSATTFFGDVVAVHELTHLLTDAGHTNDTWRLMYQGTLDPFGPKGSRRLIQSEENAIRSNSHVH